MAKKAKKLTFRQRLRADAAQKLDGLCEQAQERVTELVAGTSLDPALLMQLASSPGHTKTLRENLITRLANDKEAELEALYNRQQDLELEEGKK